MGESAMIRKIRKVYTAPFYLSMNVNDPDPRELRTIARLARDADFNEILWMLETREWRSRRMGAWFSLVRPEREIPPAVLASLRTSDGYLTAADLAVAAVTLSGADAVPAIVDYQARASAERHGLVGKTSALLELLGAPDGRDLPTENDRESVAKMLAMARLIQKS
jgi:hypothetical protein